MTRKALIRRLIVATSVPMIAPLYLAVYWVLVRFAVRRLRRFALLRAIYLRRGLASVEVVPGIADIDLAVVGDWDAAAQARIASSYTRMARCCPLFDPTFGVYTPATLGESHALDPFLRHRLAEGQRHWKLLHGEDCLAHFGPLSENDAATGYEAELRLWWTYFARCAFSVDTDLSDRIFLNSLCYKAVAESLRMDSGLNGRPVPELRRDSIAQALRESTAAEAAVLNRLADSAQRRHLRYHGNLFGDVHSFLVPRLENCYRRLTLHPAWRAAEGVRVRVDSPKCEHLDEREALAGAAHRIAGPRWGGVSVVSGAAFAMDDRVLVFEPKLGWLPDAAELSHLARTCTEQLGHPRRRLNLYFRLSSAALQFHASDFFRAWQAILWPPAHPDIFGEPSFWTPPAAAFIRYERLLLTETLDNPALYKANNLDFLRTVWKFLELVVAERSAAGGMAVLAQTPEAVLRGLRHIGAPQAPFLESFAAAWRNELAGAPSRIGKDIPAAVEYMKTINHEFCQ